MESESTVFEVAVTKGGTHDSGYRLSLTPNKRRDEENTAAGLRVGVRRVQGGYAISISVGESPGVPAGVHSAR